jgi:putative PIN family toxin of toxin-antitoxin system
MKKRVVIDTNVVVSALLTPFGKPSGVLELFFGGEIELYYCDEILAEYRDVLSRPSLKISPAKMDRFLLLLQRTGIMTESTVSDVSFRDESDRVFYDTARENDAVLVTGNTKHFPAEPYIMTPADFLSSYR